MILKVFRQYTINWTDGGKWFIGKNVKGSSCCLISGITRKNLAGATEENEEHLSKNDWRPCRDKN
jgi:hypothetical protein